MKKIKTTDITSTSAMPLKKGSLDHLQAAYTETIQDVNKAYWAGDRAGTQPMALHGLINSGSGSTFTISAGALMLDTYSEVFRCDAQTVVVNVGQVLVGTVTTTYLTATDADPVEFSDSTSNNVHEIRKIVWSSALSGTGTLNYSDLFFRNTFDAIIPTLSGDLNAWTLGTGSVSYLQLIESKKITILIEINNTTTAGANNTLTVSVAAMGGVFKQGSFTLAYFNAAGATEWALVETIAATSTIRFTRINSAFGTYTNSLDLKCQIIGELV
jgi:hypothetical protein